MLMAERMMEEAESAKPRLNALALIKRSEYLDRAAYDYNLSRSALLIPRPGEAMLINGRQGGLPSYVERHLAVVTGFWLQGGDGSCRPEKGDHADGCAHGLNLIPARASDLARLVYGKDKAKDGYIAQSKKAMDYLALSRVQARWREPDGSTLTKTGGILSTLARDGRDSVFVEKLRGNTEFLIAFDPFLHRDLMRGHFQYIPVEVVQALIGDLDFKVYRVLVCAAQTYHLIDGSRQSVEFAVTGPNASITPAQLGFGVFTTDNEIAEQLQGSFERINEKQADYDFTLVDRGGSVGKKIILQYPENISPRHETISPRHENISPRHENVLKSEEQSDYRLLSDNTTRSNGQKTPNERTEEEDQQRSDMKEGETDSDKAMKTRGDKWHAITDEEQEYADKAGLLLSDKWGEGPTTAQFRLLDWMASKHPDGQAEGWHLIVLTIEDCPTGDDPIEFLRGKYWDSIRQVRQRASREREEAYRASL